LPERPVVGHQVVREYVYGFMAVSPFDGRSSCLILPWSDSHTMSIFLRHTARRFPGEFVLMFLDGAGWHRSAELDIPSRVRLVRLPPYSPELNPVEPVWDLIRRDWFRNDVFKSLTGVEERLSKAMRWLVHHPEQVESVTGFDWIKTITLT
jgi:transposase